MDGRYGLLNDGTEPRLTLAWGVETKPSGYRDRGEAGALILRKGGLINAGRRGKRGRRFF